MTIRDEDMALVEGRPDLLDVSVLTKLIPVE